MLTLPRCHILTQDEIFPEIEQDGHVVVVGESPNATVRISIPDRTARKFRVLDRLTRASFTRSGDTWTFTGVSSYLSEEVAAVSTKLSVQVTPEPGCEDCRK